MLAALRYFHHITRLREAAIIQFKAAAVYVDKVLFAFCCEDRCEIFQMDEMMRQRSAGTAFLHLGKVGNPSPVFVSHSPEKVS